MICSLFAYPVTPRHRPAQVAAVLAMSDEVSEADLLEWARNELPPYQVEITMTWHG